MASRLFIIICLILSQTNLTEIYAQAKCSPVFDKQPENLNAYIHTTVVLKCKAKGNNLTYKWYQNKQLISTQKSPNLLLRKVTVADAGSYHVKAINQCGTAISNTVLVSIIEPASVLAKAENNNKNIIWREPEYANTIPATNNREYLQLLEIKEDNMNWKNASYMRKKPISVNENVFPGTIIEAESEGGLYFKESNPFNRVTYFFSPEPTLVKFLFHIKFEGEALTLEIRNKETELIRTLHGYEKDGFTYFDSCTTFKLEPNEYIMVYLVNASKNKAAKVVPRSTGNFVNLLNLMEL